MSAPEPLLSICVPTFNRDYFLERNVTFHLREFRRLGVAFEIVVVDDCSTDNTAAYIESVSSEPEVNAYRRLTNSGFVSNYAFAMRRARGRYAIFLGDDDLLIPEKVVEYLDIMEADPQLGMIQAPWEEVYDRGGESASIGPFYRFPEPTRIARQDFRGFLAFIFAHHAFPEFLIVRREILAKSISGSTPFIFWAFLYTARALAHGDILFLPAPFARVTAVSDDPRQHQGNTECMFQWDRYRGGLEYIVSLMWRSGNAADLDRQAVAGAINQFMHDRQSVALRLHIQARNWMEAYILHHRMSAYGPVTIEGATFEAIASMASMSMAAIEACEFTSEPVIVDPMVSDHVIALLPEKLNGRLTRDLPDPGADAHRVWLRVNPEFGDPIRPGDTVFEIPDYLAQCI